VDEALRMLDALIHVEEFGEVCPANWMVGKLSLKPNRESVENYFSVKKS
jgi:Peroxiredoxin